VVDRANVVAADHVLQLLDLGAIDVLEGSALQIIVFPHHPDVTGDDVIMAVSRPKRRNQFRANLPKRACNQNFLHDLLATIRNWQAGFICSNIPV